MTPTFLGLSPFWCLVITVAIGIMAAARLTRLIVNDDFPPVLWFRARWNHWTREGTRLEHWNKLPHCPWCFGPWATLLVFGIGFASGWHVAWYLFFGWLAAAYVTSWIVFHDEDGAPQ